MVIQYFNVPNTRFPAFNPLQNLALLAKDLLTGQFSAFINTNNGTCPKLWPLWLRRCSITPGITHSTAFISEGVMVGETYCIIGS